ncbi:MAG: OmpA family protein [Candidatus Aminicenantes bacterium]|nr:OmpA family protein [Candidatus Aminicenantes bacterium]
MKRILILLFILISFLSLFSQEKKKIFDIRKAYTYKPASLLISETDLNCSFFISKKIGKDVVIVGAEETFIDRNLFTDGDKLVINRGSVDGIKEGDMWVVIEQGKRISGPYSLKFLGTYHLKKSLAEVTCLYEDTAVITLTKGCNPVQIGDFLLPFKQEDTVFKKKINYRECRLPESPFEGVVVYNDLAVGLQREIAATSNYVAVDLGKALLSKGNFLLFYKIIKNNLPPLITGLGIVINPQNTNSTVKILDASYHIELGDRVVLIAEEPIETLEDAEKVPIVEALKTEQRADEIQKVEISILFDIDSKTVDSKFDSDFERIKEFIASKSQFAIILKGYSCSIGNLEYNLKLSKERVDNVREILIKRLGIGEDFIESYFYGEEEMPFDDSSEEQRRKNRLVTLQVIAK